VNDAAVAARLVHRELRLLLQNDEGRSRAGAEDRARRRQAYDPAAHDDRVDLPFGTLHAGKVP